MVFFILRRFAVLVASLAASSVVIFFVIEVAPGDPASIMLGINAREDTLAALRTELGLDQPMIQRYLGWVGGMLTGDFGTSYAYRSPVGEMIGERLWVSLPLAIYALLLSVLIAFPAGVYAAARRGKPGDMVAMGLSQIGIAVPGFWLAMLLVLVFAINLRWFSAGGFPGWDAGFFAALKALTLPAFALAALQGAVLTRIMRSSLLDTLGEDFVRTARAKGLTERQALWGHALRNALIPVLTIIGLQFSFLLAGSVIIERVFFLPGLGALLLDAIGDRDLIVVESVVMVLVFFVITVNFVVDLAYALADPRLRVRT